MCGSNDGFLFLRPAIAVAFAFADGRGCGEKADDGGEGGVGGGGARVSERGAWGTA